MANEGTLSPLPFFTALDGDGAPISGAKLYTYETGTSTPATVYSDPDLDPSHALSNPLVADSSGRFVPFYLQPISYRYLLTDENDVTIKTIDPVGWVPTGTVNLTIQGVAGETILAGQCVYLSDGSGGNVAGRWYLADADFAYASSDAPSIGIAVDDIASAATGAIQVGGRASVINAVVAGTVYYVSATAGSLTATAPANRRLVGVADSTTTVVLTPSVPASELGVDVGIVEGRLTLTTGTPVTTGDVSAATTLYFAPYLGNRISLYDGSANWATYTFSQLSITLVGTTASRPYDVFLYDNSGTLTLEIVVWTSATARATALTTQDGVYVKTGATNKRYLGTVYINATGGQSDDTYAKRYVWNYYNRVPRPMRVLEATNSWTYTNTAYQQANASTANQLDVMVGVAEVPIDVRVTGVLSNSVANTDGSVAIGEDSTTTMATGCINIQPRTSVNGYKMGLTAFLRTFPAIGRHTYVWLEASDTGGGNAGTFYGDNGGAVMQTGIQGEIWG